MNVDRFMANVVIPGNNQVRSFFSELVDIRLKISQKAHFYFLAVVATAAGGIPDKVFDGRNGYLVRPGDVDDLAAKLRLALAQREQWDAWGEESVRIVETTFAWSVVARKTKALYEEMLWHHHLT